MQLENNYIYIYIHESRFKKFVSRNMKKIGPPFSLW